MSWPYDEGPESRRTPATWEVVLLVALLAVALVWFATTIYGALLSVPS